MRKPTIVCTSTAVGLMVFFAGISTAQQFRSPASEPYEPTRLEWIALHLQAHYADTKLSDTDGMSLSFLAMGKETILIYATRLRRADTHEYDKNIEHARRIIQTILQPYEWGHSIKVEVRRNVAD